MKKYTLYVNRSKRTTSIRITRGPSMRERSWSFSTEMGRHGVVRFPSGTMPWRLGERLFWRRLQCPDLAVYASPDPLGCLYQGRYLSSKVKSWGHGAALARGAVPSSSTTHAMRLARQIANHRRRILSRQLVQRSPS